MLKNNITKLFIISLVVFGISTETLANIRIRFTRGRTSATVNGKVGTGGRVCYVADAKRGQTLSATVSSRSGRVRIFEGGERSYVLEVEYSGDQSVCVDNLGSATSYTLTVSIS